MLYTTQNITFFHLLAVKVKAYFELVKFRLSALVSFSSAFGYLVANQGPVDWSGFLLFVTGGFLISGSAITLNQIFEKELDSRMKRTMNRPIPTARVNLLEAYLFSSLLLLSGILLLSLSSGWLVIVFSVISLILYAFVYTPLKRIGPVAVFIGAVPGALPPLIGWVAARGMVETGSLVMFLVQFIWQFPHFWAIAWVADEDYKKAGFKLLPVNGKTDVYTSLTILAFTLLLVPAGWLPVKFGITGVVSAILATMAGCYFIYRGILLIREGSRSAALGIMYSSFVYLPVVQIAYLIDKI